MKHRISPAECEELYIKYQTPEHIIRHCKAVANAAYKVAAKLNENGCSYDLDLILGAGMAHDVVRLEDKHWEAGAEILADLGYLDEADIVKQHMMHPFDPTKPITELDLVCLGDRIVKEDQYVGVAERIQYILNKAPKFPGVEERIMKNKALTDQLVANIEKTIGQSLDSLFK